MDPARDAWETIGEPRITFILDSGRTVSWLFMHLGLAEVRGSQRLTIQCPIGTMEITGNSVHLLHGDFAKGKATRIMSDGKDITQVRWIANQAPVLD
jgi:hypothetical protein